MSATVSNDRNFHVIEVVADRLEGAPRRVRREWSQAFKDRLVAEALVPGANVSVIARREGIAPAQLFGWKRLAIRVGLMRQAEVEEPPHFVEVKSSAHSIIDIIVNGMTIRTLDDTSDAHLQRVIRVVRLA